MRCAKCMLEFDKGEMLFPDDVYSDEAVEMGLAFCVLCSIPQGNPAEV